MNSESADTAGSNRLVTPSAAHIDALMTWFPDAAAVALWSPSNAFPFERARFIREAKLDELASFMLVDAQDSPLGFGQFYQRLQCCHLGRVVVNPARRGQGLGKELLLKLLAKGSRELGLQRCSLFVLEQNRIARKLYSCIGFSETVYPETLPLAGCLYLTLDYPAAAVPQAPRNL